MITKQGSSCLQVGRIADLITKPELRHNTITDNNNPLLLTFYSFTGFNGFLLGYWLTGCPVLSAMHQPTRYCCPAAGHLITGRLLSIPSNYLQQTPVSSSQPRAL
uniref:ARAD1D17204p n=1 Tax=Blastobotrys adeninivorans TaxID=409370 RepID=A0A060T9U3_BLAAD